MTWTEAIELVIERTCHERYRRLCADDHTDREVWRARMVEMATGELLPPRPIDTILAEAKAAMGDGPVRIEPQTGCCGGGPA